MTTSMHSCELLVDAGVPWVNQRRNYEPNPDLVKDAATWQFSGGAARQSPAGDLGKSGIALIRTASSVPIAQNSTMFAVLPGDSVAISATGSVPSGASMNLDLQWFNASGGSIGYANRAILAGPTSAPTRFGAVVVAPADAASARARLFCDSGPAAFTAYGTDVLIEKATQLRSFFDGDTPSSDPLTIQYRWGGTPNASESVMQTRELPTLALGGGSVTLDSGKSPLVQADFQITVNDAATLAMLDTRTSPPPRVALRVDAVFPSGVQSRTFDLTLRSRGAQQADGSVALHATSDEGLLFDYAPLADDASMFALQPSLRAIVNSVLTKAGAGGPLQAGPDYTVRALAPSRNLIRNPRARDNTTDWTSTWTTGGLSLNRFGSGGPAGSPTYVQAYQNQASGGATGVYVYITEAAIGLTAGNLYRLSVTVNPPSGMTVSLDAILYDQAGNILAFATPVNVVGNGAWQRVTTSFYAVAGTAKLRPRVNVAGTFAYGAYFGISAWRLSEGTADAADTDFFDGDTAQTADYKYAYPASSTPGAAVATRTPLHDAPTPDALLWKAGQYAIDFLLPLVQALGLRLVCDENRAWSLRDANYAAPGTVAIRYGVNMVDASDSIDRAAGIWYDAAVVVYQWEDRATGIQYRRVDAFALKTPYSRVLRIEKATAYPGPGFAEYTVRRAQGRGREVTAKAVADWTTQTDQSAEITSQYSPLQVGSVQAITFTVDDDEMEITTRTVDLPAGAIDLLQGTIDALAGTIDSL